MSCQRDFNLLTCCVFGLFHFNSLFAQFNQVPDEIEYQALLDLYNSTNGENWLNNSNWLHGNTIGDMATWHGVTVANGDVVEIVLNKNNLTGSIPYSIGDLLNLNYFNVYDNELTGEIPSSIGKLTKLTHLYLGRNPLQGIIPDQLSSLTNLTYLYLDYTNLEGAVPEWIGTFTNLYHLYLGGPKTIGGLPTSMSNLTKLRHLSVSLIPINGPLPNWIHNFKNLNLLYATQCGLTGKIPEWLGELPLKLLIMPKNHLEGELPKSFANLTELTHLFYIFLKTNLKECFRTI